MRGQPLPDRRSRTALLGTELSELHTGYRAFSRKLLLDGAVPAQLARLRVRHRAADAGRALRLPLPRGAVRDDLLQRGVVGVVPAGRRLRSQDAVGRRAPGPAPPGHLAVQEVPGVKRVCVFSGLEPGRATSPTAPPRVRPRPPARRARHRARLRRRERRADGRGGRRGDRGRRRT